MDKNKSVKNFLELSESELNMVNGGDFWSDFWKKFVPINRKAQGTLPKIG